MKKRKYLSSLDRGVDDFDGFLGRHESRSGNGALIGRSDVPNPDAICFMHSVGGGNDVQLIKSIKQSQLMIFKLEFKTKIIIIT